MLIPQVVQQELADERSPIVVQAWISQLPEWLAIQAVDFPSDCNLDDLDPGERAAIALAQQGADLILIDDLLGDRLLSRVGRRHSDHFGIFIGTNNRNWKQFAACIHQVVTAEETSKGKLTRVVRPAICVKS